MRSRRIVGVLVVWVVLAAVAPAGTTGAASADEPAAAVDGGTQAEVPTVRLTQTFSRLVDEPGLVRTVHAFDIPDSVEELRTSIPAGATVVSTSGGFEHTGGSTYIWDGGSQAPSITFRLSVNRTGSVKGPEGTDGRYRFVDVGEWGLFRRPPAPMDVTYYGSGIDFAREAVVDGAGAAGDTLVFVGPVDRHRHSAAGQAFTLVEPAAANLLESPDDVFASVGLAAGALQAGARDPTVFMIAAPTSVDWAVDGLASGSDFYATADERLDVASNTWLHEYVHTRQSFNLTAGTRWLTEATATYYGALLTLEQDRIEFRAFHDFLESGTWDRYDDGILAEPSTWSAGENYRKGALVVGDLDRRLRLATDSQRSFQTPFRDLNEAHQVVDADGFVARIAESSPAVVGDAADRFTRTAATPDVWDRAAHQDAFGQLPSRIAYDLNGTVRVAGRYRNGTLDGGPSIVVPNEHLGFELSIANVGCTPGTYEVRYGLADGEQQTTSGRLGAGESVVERLWVGVDRVGGTAVRVGEFTQDVVVVEPATLEVAALDVNRSAVARGDVVGLAVEVHNPRSHPGQSDLTVRANDEPVETRTVAIGGGERRTVPIPVRLSTAGSVRLAVRNRSVAVSVGSAGGGTAGEPTASSDAAIATDGGLGPGFGLLGSVLVLLAVAFRALSRSG